MILAVILGGAKPDPPRITLDVRDADVHNVLRLLADTGKVNIVVPDEVQGRVTIKLKNVPWNEALDAILKVEGLGWERSGTVIQVDTLERIQARAEAKAEIRTARRETARLLTVIIPLRYASAEKLKPLVASMLTDRGRVAVDDRTNVLIVTDVAHNVDRVRRELGL